MATSEPCLGTLACRCRRLVRLAACACGCACALCFAPSVAAKDPPGSATEEVSPATVEPRLLQQIVPDYPEEAMGQHADVSVLVDLDSSGRVVGARFESGPDVFRAVALAAAKRLVFVPAKVAGTPVAVTTRVTFHFAPPSQGDDDLVEIDVHAEDPDREDTRARTTLDEEELEKAAGDDLATTLSGVAGVQMAQGTADAAKPIIRGQSERRLLVLNNGVRHESQKWGPEHATEIDPFSAGSISVVRGAAGARYGPDAIGGVVLVEPPPLRVDPGVGGKTQAAFSSNGLRPYGALRLDAVPEGGPITLRVEGNAAGGASPSAPDYVLGNTASQVWNAGGTIGYRMPTGEIRATFHHHDFRAGVFYGVRNSTPSDFEDQLAADRPVTADLWDTSYTIDRPFQDVTHDVVLLRADLPQVEAVYAFQYNRRREYEQVRDSITGPQFDFTLRTHSVDLLYRHPIRSFSFADLEGGVGLQSSFQENVYRGLSLIPNYRTFSGGVFAYERLSFPRVDVEVGARFDGLTRSAFLLDNDFDAHVRRGTLLPRMCDPGTDTRRCPADYHTGSVSAGMLGHVVPETFDVKLDLSTASRFPNIDELYLLGSTPSFPVYANGNPSLGVETAYGASLTTGLRTDIVETEVSVFGQYVDDYIYFAPELNDRGRPRFDVTIRGTWPTFGYQPIDAAYYGVDGSLQLGPSAPVGLDVRGALVRAQDIDNADHLVGTPPDRVHLALVGRPPPAGPIAETEIQLTTDIVGKQSRVDPAVDFAPAPNGYALLGAGVQTEVGRKGVRVGIDAHNILNTAYREYTSLLRYYADQPGRDVRVRVGMDI